MLTLSGEFLVERYRDVLLTRAKPVLFIRIETFGDSIVEHFVLAMPLARYVPESHVVGCNRQGGCLARSLSA